MTLWDLFEAEQARDEALARVERNASDDWKETVLHIIRDLAVAQDELTTDDVWQVLELRGIEATHEPRALGAVMRHAASLGMIERTDTTRRSVRVARHAGDVRVWRCLL